MSVATRSRGAATTKGAAQRPVPALRFVASAHEHREPINNQGGIVLGAAQIQSTPSNIPIPAYGFLAHVLLLVTWTGGAGVLAADAPGNIFASVSIQDVNGAFLQNPVDGFALMMENVYGGYAYRQDPRLSPIYSATAASGAYMMRIPVMVTRHNAYGALANQNAAAPYYLQYTINTFANVYSTATTAPTVVVQAYLEAWSQPNARDLKGRPQAQLPPLHGSTQQWSQYTKAIAVGNNIIQLVRVGNTIRTIVAVCRNNTGGTPRDDTVHPNPFTLNLDSRVLTSEIQQLRQQVQTEGLESTTARDTGVFVYYFNNSIIGHIGDESSDLWLPTVQSSRFELDGNCATAGNIQFLTCDIAQVETDQAARYVMESTTGNLTNPIVDQIGA